jgi:hypothetical protein
MAITTEQRITGLTTYQKFFSSLPTGEYYMQEREQDDSFSYYPVEDLLTGVPPSAQEWNINIIVNWMKDKALITRTEPRARTYAVVHKSLVPAHYRVIEAGR